MNRTGAQNPRTPGSCGSRKVAQGNNQRSKTAEHEQHPTAGCTGPFPPRPPQA